MTPFPLGFISRAGILLPLGGRAPTVFYLNPIIFYYFTIILSFYFLLFYYYFIFFVGWCFFDYGCVFLIIFWVFFYFLLFFGWGCVGVGALFGMCIGTPGGFLRCWGPWGLFKKFGPPGGGFV